MAVPIGAIDSLQERMHEWRTYNFPDADAEQQLLGVFEEIGELAHARLKQIQNIRGNEDLLDKEIDAVGDTVVYLMGFCSYRGLSFGECLARAWNEVKDRDWVRYPQNGVSE